MKKNEQTEANPKETKTKTKLNTAKLILTGTTVISFSIIFASLGMSVFCLFNNNNTCRNVFHRGPAFGAETRQKNVDLKKNTLASLSKTLPVWPAPKTLLSVKLNADNKYQLMTFAALQGLANKQAPEGKMVYFLLESGANGYPDQLWLDYYQSKLKLSVTETRPADLLDWAFKNAGIKYYIIIDPSSPSRENPETADHTSTLNIAATMSGILGNAIPVHPDDVALLQAHGYTLLPDSYRKNFGAGGDKLITPNAFDLRNQWQVASGSAPWRDRQTVYRWAIDTLLPLTDHHAISLNYESYGDFAPWLNDYVTGSKIFSYYFNPAPSTESTSNSDYALYNELLKKSGNFTMVRGWHWNEGDNIELISNNHGMHAGSKEMPNATVHAALSQLFTQTFSQKTVDPAAVTVDPNKVYLTFGVSDGDQFGVSYNFYRYSNGQKILWDDPARGQIPINWSMSALLYDYGRGMERWYFDNASPNDYFTAQLPAGYAHLTYDHFGDLLEKYDFFANAEMKRAGLSVADYLYGTGSFLASSNKTSAIHITKMTNATALREGYGNASFYQGIYWPEESNLKPYIYNAYSGGYNTVGNNNSSESGESVALAIEDMVSKASLSPMFMHINWINWVETPTDMLNCVNKLNADFPGKYELVGMPKFIALAQKAKMTGIYPLEFFPYTGGEGGMESPYMYENHGSTVADAQVIKAAGVTPISVTDYIGRFTTGDNFVTYKFNIAPAKTAALSTDIEGIRYQVYASPDNNKWTSIIKGSSTAKITETANLTPYLNAKGSVYLKFTGEMKLLLVKVDYK